MRCICASLLTELFDLLPTSLIFFFFFPSSFFYKHPFSWIIVAAFASVLHILHYGSLHSGVPPGEEEFTCSPFRNSSTVAQSEKVSRDKKVRRDWLASAWWWHHCVLTKLCVCVAGRVGVEVGVHHCMLSLSFFSSSCASNKYRGPFSQWVIFAGHKISLLDDAKLRGLLSHIFLELASTPPKKNASLLFFLPHVCLRTTWWCSCTIFRSQGSFVRWKICEHQTWVGVVIVMQAPHHHWSETSQRHAGGFLFFFSWKMDGEATTNEKPSGSMHLYYEFDLVA